MGTLLIVARQRPIPSILLILSLGYLTQSTAGSKERLAAEFARPVCADIAATASVRLRAAVRVFRRGERRH